MLDIRGGHVLDELIFSFRLLSGYPGLNYTVFTSAYMDIPNAAASSLGELPRHNTTLLQARYAGQGELRYTLARSEELRKLDEVRKHSFEA